MQFEPRCETDVRRESRNWEPVALHRPYRHGRQTMPCAVQAFVGQGLDGLVSARQVAGECSLPGFGAVRFRALALAPADRRVGHASGGHPEARQDDPLQHEPADEETDEEQVVHDPEPSVRA